MRFTFKHLTGSRAGQEQVLEGRVVNIGRNPSNLLAFDPEKDDRVSGNHAQLLVLDDGKVVLSDLGSRNGTLVNGQKIHGQLPLASGTTVQFGSEGGPEVQISYGAAPAAAPAAAAPAPAKGGNGCKIFLACFFLLLLLGCVIGGVVLALRPAKPTGGTDPTTETTIASTEATPATEAAPATEKAPATEAPKATDERTAWGKLGVGSRFEQKSVSEMKVGETVMKTETLMVYTVKSNDGKDVVVTLETSMDIPGVGPQKNSNDTTFPAKVVKAETTEKTEEPEKRKDKVTVPAGTFDCTVWTTKTKDAAGAETVTENYMGDLETDPLPYKTVMKSPTMNMTMELVKAEKK